MMLHREEIEAFISAQEMADRINAARDEMQALSNKIAHDRDDAAKLMAEARNMKQSVDAAMTTHEQNVADHFKAMKQHEDELNQREAKLFSAQVEVDKQKALWLKRMEQLRHLESVIVDAGDLLDQVRRPQ
jgi:predicted  nucleic acid-binding Zn-ribbon protein